MYKWRENLGGWRPQYGTFKGIFGAAAFGASLGASHSPDGFDIVLPGGARGFRFSGLDSEHVEL